MQTAKGVDGNVSFDGQYLTISRSGMGAIGKGGRGEIRLHVHQITGIELKKPGPIANGRFTPLVAGAQQRSSRAGSHQDDPNSVRFYKKHMEEFEAIRSAVEQAQAASSAPQQPAGPGLGGELGRLAELHDSGVLSDEEFASAKARLLG